VRSTDAPACTYTVVGGEFNPTATNDNCGVQGTSWVLSGATTGSGNTTMAGVVLNKGTTGVDWYVTDINGNSASCSFSVIVNDDDPPVFTSCPANITANVTPPGCDKIVNYTTPTATDNCPGTVTVTQTDGSGLTSGSAFPKGTTTQIWTATDAMGNTSTCYFTIQIFDNIAPSFSPGCPANITKSTDPNLCTAVVSWTPPVATDNCPGVTQTSTDNPGNTFAKGVTQVIYTATDMSGNTATCSFTVTVNDTQAPTISCPANITANTGTGDCSATVSWTVPTGSDNCPMLNVTGTHTPPAAFTVGVHTVIYTATDMSGNSATCSFTVTVTDITKPTLTCPANNVKGTDEGFCSYKIPGSLMDPTGVGDNCGVLPPNMWSLSGATPSASGNGSMANVVISKGVTTIVWKVTDVNGNTNTCSFTITVNDTENPKITCPADKMVITAPGQCSVPASSVALGTPVTSDNCMVVPPVINNSPANYPVGVTNVIWQVTDASGNTATCTQKVTVVAYTCGQPIQVYHHDTTSTTAKASWKAGKCATSYEIRIRQEISPGVWGPWGAWVPVNALTYMWTNLNPNKFHNYQVRTKCGTTFSVSINDWFWTLPAFGGTQDRVSKIPTGEEQTGPINITVVPNPAREYTILMIDGAEKTEKDVTMLDVYGKLVFKVRVKAKENRLELDLNTLGVHPGIYMIRVSDGHRQKTEQLMIER
jgi:hypothetical protein